MIFDLPCPLSLKFPLTNGSPCIIGPQIYTPISITPKPAGSIHPSSTTVHQPYLLCLFLLILRIQYISMIINKARGIQYYTRNLVHTSNLKSYNEGRGGYYILAFGTLPKLCGVRGSVTQPSTLMLFTELFKKKASALKELHSGYPDS